jgi:hypothetical protein
MAFWVLSRNCCLSHSHKKFLFFSWLAFFFLYWSWTQGFVLARFVLYCLRHASSPFALLSFERSCFFSRLVWTTIFPCTFLTERWDDRCHQIHLLFSVATGSWEYFDQIGSLLQLRWQAYTTMSTCLKWGLTNVLSRLISNCSPPNLHLPSSYDTGMSHQCPACFFLLKVVLPLIMSC